MKNQTQIRWSTKKIGPDEAKAYLALNRENRKVNLKKVEILANEMNAGKWKSSTGETIKISKSGRLLDGQHRLLAVIKAMVTIYLDFAEGLSESIMPVIDSGLKRSIANVFEFKGLKQSRSMASIIQSSNKIKSMIEFKSTSAKSKKVLLPHEALEIVESDLEFWYMVSRQSDNIYRQCDFKTTPSFIGGLYSILIKSHENAAHLFFEQIATGINLDSTSPVYHLRRILTKDQSSQSKLESSIKYALFIKAWNFFLENKKIKRLSFDINKEEFTRPIGYVKPF
jgi:hypothetical protein